MSVFETMIVAHLIGDWLLQTEWMAVNKEKRWQAMFAHVVIYHVVLLVILIIGFDFAGPSLYGTVAALAILHAVLDRKTVVIKLMTALRITVERPAEGLLLLVIDQVLHVLLLAVASLFLSGKI